MAVNVSLLYFKDLMAQVPSNMSHKQALHSIGIEGRDMERDDCYVNKHVLETKVAMIGFDDWDNSNGRKHMALDVDAEAGLKIIGESNIMILANEGLPKNVKHLILAIYIKHKVMAYGN